MLKIQQKCRVCQAIEKNPKLLQVIFNSGYYLSGGRALQNIADEHPTEFTYDSLKNHVKRHQFMTEADYKKKSLQKIAKQAQDKVIERNLDSYDVFDKVINQGLSQMEGGDLKVKGADLISAARYKKEFQLKEKDQELAMAEMVYYFASRENKESKSYDRRIIEGETVEDFDATAGVADDTGAGSDRPSGIYYPPAWNAPTPGTS